MARVVGGREGAAVLDGGTVTQLHGMKLQEALQIWPEASTKLGAGNKRLELPEDAASLGAVEWQGCARRPGIAEKLQLWGGGALTDLGGGGDAHSRGCRSGWTWRRWWEQLRFAATKQEGIKDSEHVPQLI